MKKEESRKEETNGTNEEEAGDRKDKRVDEGNAGKDRMVRNEACSKVGKWE